MPSCIVMTKIPTRNTSYYYFDAYGVEIYLIKVLKQLGFTDREITIKSLYYLRGESTIDYFSYYLYEIEGISESEMEAAIRSKGPSSPYNPCEIILMRGGDTYYKYTIRTDYKIKEKIKLNRKSKKYIINEKTIRNLELEILKETGGKNEKVWWLERDVFKRPNET